MPSDANAALQAQVTSTATAHSAGLTLAKSLTRNTLYAMFSYSLASQASGSGVWTFGLSVSYDNGNTWNADWIANEEAITLTASNQAGQFSIPFAIARGDLVLPGTVADSTHAVVLRADAVLSGTPVTPTITWQCMLQPSWI